MQFEFKKYYGQNFLINQNIIDKIISFIPTNVEKVIEIGPGMGALTIPLMQKYKIDALDIDKTCLDNLLLKIVGSFSNSYIENLTLIHADALKYSFPYEVVIGNLPYNIGTKIIENFIYNPIPLGIFMLQKEVAQRLLSHNYGKLSVFIKARYFVEKLLDVSSGNFFPKPKVESQVIILKRNNDYDYVNLKKLKYVLGSCFAHRRKKLMFLKKTDPLIWKILLLNNIDVNLRAESLAAEVYFNLSQDIVV